MTQPASIVLEPRLADLGHGLQVRRILPHGRARSVGPYVFLDHAGPVVIAREQARQADVRPHPHIGLATVSYLLSGEIMHRDSLGTRQSIVPGDVNWMTAGRGISHSERFEAEPAFTPPGIELMQCWVALPDVDEEIEPAFEHVPAAALPEHSDGGLWLRVIAGAAYGLQSPVRTRSPLFQVHLRARAGSRFELPVGHRERALYVLRGSVRCSDGGGSQNGDTIPAGLARAWLEPDAAPQLQALTDCDLMLFGGEPLGHRFLWWNFVSTRRDRIEQAKNDWRQRRIPLPPDDHDSFTPLPEDRPGP